MRRALPGWLLSALLLSAGPAEAADGITWLLIGPALEGDARDYRAAEPIGAVSIDYFSDRMDEFTHRTVIATPMRAISLAAGGDGYCIPEVLWSEERARQLVFSRPMGRALPHRLVVRRDRLEEWSRFRDDDGHVSLRSLVAESPMHGAREAGAILAKDLEAILPAGSPKVARVIDFDAAYRMLAAARVDWIIDNARQAAYFISHASDPDIYASLAIAEETALQTYYTACSKGAVGARAIAGIDKAIEAAGPFSPWRAAYLDSLDAQARLDFERMDRPR